MNQTYTVFFGDGWCACNVHMRAGASLQGLIDHWAHMSPRAWAAEWVDSFGGPKSRSELEAESIAAGRLIEKVDGKYVARGIHSPMIAAAPEEKLASVKVCGASFDSVTGVWTGSAGCADFDMLVRDREREPLDWNKSTPFDPFKGYVVYSDAVSSGFVESPKHSHSHPLQKMAEGKEGFGSAALLKG